ncbi:hypothetical protein CRG98_028782 [Punica granatum]|uniref:Uncharacterized protein n=1 Tax=Punica granatum TaxID=22663 RepID=A0A2I0J3H4_PUNGR|nr:hypothetical protein CRG98_028782 [Punica granatum]
MTSLSKASLAQLKTESDGQGDGSCFDSGDLHHASRILCALPQIVLQELIFGWSKTYSPWCCRHRNDPAWLVGEQMHCFVTLPPPPQPPAGSAAATLVSLALGGSKAGRLRRGHSGSLAAPTNGSPGWHIVSSSSCPPLPLSPPICELRAEDIKKGICVLRRYIGDQGKKRFLWHKKCF